MSATPDAPRDPLAPGAIGVAEVCAEVEAGLREYLPACLPSDLQPPATWEQLPTADAMRTAEFPAVAITSPGLVDRPQRVDRGRRYDATWSVLVTVWVRGDDGTYADTTNTTRRYTKAVRTALMVHADRAGKSWAWASEEYDALSVPGMAATLQAGLIGLEVPVIGALDLNALAIPADPAWPRVTHTTVTVSPRE